MVFVIGSVYVVNYVYRFAYVELDLHSQDESYLIMVDKLFDVLLQSVCQYLIEDFCVYLHHVYWLKFSFLVESLPGFGVRMMLIS